MADLIIKPSSGGSLKLQEDGGTDAISIDTEGVPKIKIHAFSAYNSVADCAIPNDTWTEASATGTWVENFDSLGHYASGRFTPTIQGIYLCGYSVVCGGIDHNEQLRCAIRRNGVDTATNGYAFTYQRNPGTGSNYTIGLSGSAIIQLDTNDYVSLWAEHTEGGSQNLAINETQFWGTYIGTV